MPTNYARFDVATSDPSVSFLIDCQKGEDILSRAREAVEWWSRVTDKALEPAGIAFVCMLRY